MHYLHHIHQAMEDDRNYFKNLNSFLLAIQNYFLNRKELGIAPAYSFYNMFFMLSLLWSVQSKESLEPVNTVISITSKKNFN